MLADPLGELLPRLLDLDDSVVPEKPPVPVLDRRLERLLARRPWLDGIRVGLLADRLDDRLDGGFAARVRDGVAVHLGVELPGRPRRDQHPRPGRHPDGRRWPEHLSEVDGVGDLADALRDEAERDAGDDTEDDRQEDRTRERVGGGVDRHHRHERECRQPDPQADRPLGDQPAEGLPDRAPRAPEEPRDARRCGEPEQADRGLHADVSHQQRREDAQQPPIEEECPGVPNDQERRGQLQRSTHSPQDGVGECRWDVTGPAPERRDQLARTPRDEQAPTADEDDHRGDDPDLFGERRSIIPENKTDALVQFITHLEQRLAESEVDRDSEDTGIELPVRDLTAAREHGGGR